MCGLDRARGDYTSASDMDLRVLLAPEIPASLGVPLPPPKRVSIADSTVAFRNVCVTIGMSPAPHGDVKKLLNSTHIIQRLDFPDLSPFAVQYLLATGFHGTRGCLPAEGILACGNLLLMADGWGGAFNGDFAARQLAYCPFKLSQWPGPSWGLQGVPPC